MNKSDTIISIIILTHNSAEIVVERVLEVIGETSRIGTEFEIVLVDNGSSDNSIELVTMQKRVMRHTRIVVLNKQYDADVAFTAGLDTCVGDYAVLFDLRFDPVSEIGNIFSRLVSDSDIIIGRPKRDLFKRSLIFKLVIGLLRRLSSNGFSFDSSFFIGMNRKAVNSMMRTRRKSRDFGYISSFIGLKRKFFYYWPVNDPRNLIKIEGNDVRDIFTIVNTVVSHSFKPMRLISLLGMTISIMYLIWTFIIVILYVLFGIKSIVPQGWISLSTVLGVLFFLLFSLVTLVSEYIVRILSESRDEPFYFVTEEINKSVVLGKKQRLNVV